MQQLGTLGSRLVQAARESDSAVADLITTQKQSIEQERKAHLTKVAGKGNQWQPSGKKRPYSKKKSLPQTITSSESSEPRN